MKKKLKYEGAMRLWQDLCSPSGEMRGEDFKAACELFTEESGWTYDELWGEWHNRQNYPRS